ncbi:MAG: drug/metabolite transporter (DMT)-like permease [Granulosicoccus sp.]|jgi:drug/metabolite transporter (DMT)-like permease
MLVLMAALLHASWNALVKSGGAPEFTIASFQLFGGIVSLCLVWFVPIPDPASWPLIFASVVVHNLYYMTMAQAYKAGDLSQVYPLFRGLAPVLVAIAALIFANERLDTGTIAGIVLISAGLMSITLLGQHFGKIPKKALHWGLITSVLIAGYTVVDGIGVRLTVNPLSYIVWLFAFEFIPIVTWLLLTQRQAWFNYIRHSKVKILFGGLASNGAYALVIYAMSLGAMAIVSSLRETSVIFAALIGTLLLGEPFGRQRAIAALLVALGIIIMRVW